MKKIKAALIIMVWMILMMFFLPVSLLIIMAWMMLMMFLLPVSLVGGISAKIGERINKGFRRYLDNVFGGLE